MGALALTIIGGTLAIAGIALIEAYERFIDAYIEGHERVLRVCEWLGLIGDEQ